MKRACCAMVCAALLLFALAAAAETLRPGARGPEVVRLQEALRAQGYAIAADGVYGRATRAAVVRYQRANGLWQDGIAGAKTQELLYAQPAPQPDPASGGQPDPAPAEPAPTYETLRMGMRGSAVRALQQALIGRGYALTADGAFGRMTERAVRAFQSSSGLKADGVAGAATWQKLSGGPGGGDAAGPDGGGSNPGTASVARALSRGASGEQVQHLQTALALTGANVGGADGKYGSKTAAAVSAFQRQYGIKASGTADPVTLALLYAKTGTASDALMTAAVNHTGAPVALRATASRGAGTVLSVPAGAAVTLLREADGWYHAAYKNRGGYLPVDAVRALDRPAPLANLAQAFRPEAYSLTGDHKSDLMGIAFSQLGFQGGSRTEQTLSGTGPGGPYSKYGAYYNDPGESYCSYFISWSARQAAISENVINNARDVDGVFYDQQGAFVYFFAPAPAQVQAARLRPESRIARDSYTPQPGDLIYFRWNNARATTTFSHIGIVYQADDQYVYTLEGAAGGSVDTRMYSLSAPTIVGYARPAY